MLEIEQLFDSTYHALYWWNLISSSRFGKYLRKIIELDF